MERIIEENELEWSSSYALSSHLPYLDVQLTWQKIRYLNEVAVFNIRRHEYAMSLEQFSLLSAIFLSNPTSAWGYSHSFVEGITMSSILNNVVVGLIMLSDFKAAETLIIRSLEFSEVRVL